MDNISIIEIVEKEFGFLPSNTIFLEENEIIKSLIKEKYLFFVQRDDYENSLYINKTDKLAVLISTNPTSNILVFHQHNNTEVKDAWSKTIKVNDEEESNVDDNTLSGILIRTENGSIDVMWDTARKIPSKEETDIMFGEDFTKKVENFLNSKKSGIGYIKGGQGYGKSRCLKYITDIGAINGKISLRIPPIPSIWTDTELIRYIFSFKEPPIILVDDISWMNQLEGESRIGPLTYILYLTEPRPEWGDLGCSIFLSGENELPHLLSQRLIFNHTLEKIESKKCKLLSKIRKKNYKKDFDKDLTLREFENILLDNNLIKNKKGFLF